MHLQLQNSLLDWQHLQSEKKKRDCLSEWCEIRMKEEISVPEMVI
jgi:hypothetical protein